MYRFKIIKTDAGFRVQFLYNKEVVFWTETYKSKPSAKKAIESITTKGQNAEIVEEDQTSKALAAAKAAAPKPAAKTPVKAAAKKDAPVKAVAKPAAAKAPAKVVAKVVTKK